MAEFNEENSETDPYEALAAAMSGNTGGAVTGQEEETSETTMESETVITEAESVQSQSTLEQVQQPTQSQPTPTKAQEMELRPTNEEQAQAWFKVEGSVDKLDVHDLAGLQLAQKENPNNFTDAQHQQVKDLAWKKIQNVANRKDKLETKDCKGFESLLKNVPTSYRMETSQELGTIKSAESRLYRARNGIEDKSLGEKAKDGLDRAKVSGTKVLQQSKTGLKKAFITGLNKIDKGLNNIDKGMDKIDEGIYTGLDKMAGRINKFGKSVSAYAYNKKEHIKQDINKAKVGGAKVLQQSKTGLKKAFITGLNKIDKGLNNIDKGMDKIDKGIYTGLNKMAGLPNKFAKSVSAYAYNKKEHIKQDINKAKINSVKVLKQSKIGLKKAFIAGLNKIDNGLDNIDKSIYTGLDKMAGRLDKFGKSVSAYAYHKKEEALSFITNNKLVRGVKKTIKGVKTSYKNTVNFGKNVVKGVKNAYNGTINFGKKVYNGGKNAVKAVQKGYKNTKEFVKNANNVFKKEPTDKEKAVKLSKGKLDSLTPEQIAFVYNTLKDIDQRRDPHSKEVNALCAIQGFADRKMDAISADKSILTAGNAKQAAEWLNISQYVQDKVNHNRVEAKNERNNNVALALQSYGLDTKMVTATEKQEAANKTDVNSDAQEQVVKQDAVNTSPDNIIQVQKNEQEAEKFVKPQEPEKPKTQVPTQPEYDSEALSKALSGNTETAVNATVDEKTKIPTENKNMLRELSGRSNEAVSTKVQNPEKTENLDKVQTPNTPNPSLETPKTDNKPVQDQEKTATPKGNKKHLTKEEKAARKTAHKLFAKTGRGKNSSNGTKGSPTIVRDLNPNLKEAIKGGRQSA